MSQRLLSPTTDAEWIIMVGHRSNSEPNLPRAEQFDERADIVAGLPASEMKGAIKRRAWPMCSSDCEARSMATKRQRVSTRSRGTVVHIFDDIPKTDDQHTAVILLGHLV